MPSEVRLAILCTATESVVGSIERQLSSFMLEVLSSPELVTNLLSSIRPAALLLADLEFSREVRFLIAKANAHSVPTVVLGSNCAAEALRWLQEGATDCCSAIEFLETRLEQAAAPRAALPSRVIEWAKLERLTAAFCVLPGTPLEGRAEFRRGELITATFRRLEGIPALSEMLKIRLGALTPA